MNSEVCEMANFDRARTLLQQFKGDTYLHGLHVLPQVGSVTAQAGKRAVLVRNTFTGSEVFTQMLKASLAAADVQLLGEVEGAAPNAPREDLFRITKALIDLQPDVLIS